MLKLRKSTRYALYAALGMAQAAADDIVTVAQVAERYGIPATVLAKVFQHLVRSGIAVGTRGVGGGYRLAKRASELTVLDVIRAFEPSRSSGNGLLKERPRRDCAEPPHCSLRRIFDELDEQVRCTFASITFETLVRRPRLLTWVEP